MVNVRWDSGADLCTKSLVERKALLYKIILPKPKQTLLAVDAIAEQGEAFFAQAVALSFEGLTAKRRHSTYLPGVRTADRRKIKRRVLYRAAVQEGSDCLTSGASAGTLFRSCLHGTK